MTPTTLSVDYGSQAEVYFEVYDAEPVKPNAEGTAYVKVEDIEPLYAGYTDVRAGFSAEVDPSGLPRESLYLHTQRPCADAADRRKRTARP